MFTFHLTEKTTRKLLADPLLPSDPTFEDIRTALARLDTAEVSNNPQPPRFFNDQ